MQMGEPNQEDCLWHPEDLYEYLSSQGCILGKVLSDWQMTAVPYSLMTYITIPVIRYHIVEHCVSYDGEEHERKSLC